MAPNIIIKLLLTISYWGIITPWAYGFVGDFTWNLFELLQTFQDHIYFSFFILIGYFIFNFITGCLYKILAHYCNAGKDRLTEVTVHHSKEAIQALWHKVTTPAAPATPISASLSSVFQPGVGSRGIRGTPPPQAILHSVAPAPPISASLSNLNHPEFGSQRIRGMLHQPTTFALRKSFSLNQLVPSQVPLATRRIMAQPEASTTSSRSLNVKKFHPYQNAPDKRRKQPVFCRVVMPPSISHLQGSKGALNQRWR